MSSYQALREEIRKTRRLVVSLKADIVDLEAAIERNNITLYFAGPNEQIAATLERMHSALARCKKRLDLAERYVDICLSDLAAARARARSTYKMVAALRRSIAPARPNKTRRI